MFCRDATMRRFEEPDNFRFVRRSNPFSKKDLKLQYAKRLDWRFLLSDPLLKRVAIVGEDRGDLYDALNVFSQTLKPVIQSDRLFNANKPGSQFDLVVYRSFNLKDLRLAAELLKPGGHLYWEIDKRRFFSIKPRQHKKRRSDGLISSIRLSRRSYCYGTLKAHLKSLGFTDVQFQWHRPNFKQCLEIIPLNNRIVLEYLLSRAKSNLSGKLKLSAGRFLLNIGLLKYIVQCVSILACKKNLKNP